VFYIQEYFKYRSVISVEGIKHSLRKSPTFLHKTLQRKLKIEQHDHTKNGGALEGQAVQAPLVASTILKSILKNDNIIDAVII
jgi:hypothetical protein